MAPKRPAEPGMAAAMKRSSPRTLCHFRVLMRRLSRRSSKMEDSRALRRSVSSRVPVAVSRIHPRTSLRWFQPPSPFASFFSEMASFRVGWSVSGRAKTPSTACMMQRLAFRQRRWEPWATPMKSSTNTSTCATGEANWRSGARSPGGGRGGGRGVAPGVGRGRGAGIGPGAESGAEGDGGRPGDGGPEGARTGAGASGLGAEVGVGPVVALSGESSSGQEVRVGESSPSEGGVAQAS
jgi:hypothetical protein